MGNSKIILGNETLIDLTSDTVTPDTLLAGTTAHDRSGNQIVGTVTVPDTLDDLTDVSITSAADGQVLVYKATTQKWENGTGGTDVPLSVVNGEVCITYETT